MLLTAAFFWLFATVLTLSAVAVVTARNESADSAFSAACKWARDAGRVLSAAERSTAAACAAALAASPHLSPAHTAHCGRTALSSACGAGLAAVVSVWLADDRATQGVVLRQDVDGVTAASALLKRAASAPQRTAGERRDTAACATALAGSAHLPRPLRAQLTAAAAVCEAAVMTGGRVRSRSF